MEKRNLAHENPIVKYLYVLSNFSEYIKNACNDREKGNLLGQINPQYEIEYMKSKEVLSLLNSKNKKEKEIAKKLFFEKIRKELKLDIENELDSDFIFDNATQILSNIERIFKNKMNLIRCIEQIYVFMLESNKLFYLMHKMLKNENKIKYEKLIVSLKGERDKYERKANDENIEISRLNNEINLLKELMLKNSEECQIILNNNRIELEQKYQKLKEDIEFESVQKHQKLINESEQKHQKLIDELEQKHQKQIDELEQKHQKQKDESEQKHQKQIDESEQKHQKQIDELEQKYQKLINESEQKHQKLIDESEQKHQKLIDELEQKHQKQIDESEQKHQKLIDELEQKHQKQIDESEQRYQKLKMESNLNTKQLKERIKLMEEKVQEINKSNIILSKKVEEAENQIQEVYDNDLKNYNFLLDKYRNLLDINLHNLLTEKETKKIFNSYSEKINNVLDENNKLKINNEKLKMEIDQLGIEIDLYKNYIKTTRLEIDSGKIK